MAQIERLFIEHSSNRSDPTEMHPPEQIYSSLWQKWHREGLVSLPLPRPAMSQEDAVVAAGIIQYLGTKGGILLLTRVRRDIDSGIATEKAWLKELRRFTTECWSAVNKGFTAFELCLTPAWTAMQRHYSVCCRPRDPELAREATKRELQVARAVFRWLSTIPGQIFIDEAENLIKADAAHRQAVYHCTWNLCLIPSRIA